MTRERIIEKGTFYFILKQGGLCPREPPPPSLGPGVSEDVSNKFQIVNFQDITVILKEHKKVNTDILL